MTLPSQIAKHLREVYFGGNWTSSNFKDNLADLSWEQAATQVYSFNSIVTLLYHTHYYIDVVIKVMQGEPLDAKDKYSFEHPPVRSQEDWEKLLDTTWADAEKLATMIEQLPETKLWEDFWDKKYGNYYRNFNGIIEHLHYHLGQIVLIKKILVQAKEQ